MRCSKSECRRVGEIAICAGAAILYKCGNGHFFTNRKESPAAAATLDSLREQKLQERKR